MKTARTWIVVHDGMPDHPKIEALSDRAFRALITLWCWCSRQLTDGHVPKSAWEKRATPAVRRELLASGLVEQLPSGDVSMHDYLDWQRSAATVREASEKKQAAARLGNHNRWHVKEHRVDPTCELCMGPFPGEISPENRSDSDGISSESSGGPLGDSTKSGSTTTRPDAGRSVADQHGCDERYIAPAIAPASHSGTSTDNGATPKRRGEERRGEGGLVGGGRSSNGRADFQAPRPRCSKHSQLPPDADVPPCRACQQVRLDSERQVADNVLGELAERTARRAAIDACGRCDDNGMRETDTGVTRCAHSAKLEAVS